jgi:hypothetical protein
MLTVLDVTECCGDRVRCGDRLRCGDRVRCGDRMRINFYSNESEERYSEIIMFFMIRFFKTLFTLLNCINCV